MGTAVWAVALGSTLAWAVFDAIRKGLVARVPVLALSFWVSAAQLPGYLLWLWLEPEAVPTDGYVLWAGISIALNLVANLLFLEAMRRAPLSTVVPVLSLTPVFVALQGMLFLGEFLLPSQWAGVGLVSAGAIGLTAPRGRASPMKLLRAFVGQKGVGLMMAVAQLWALTPIADKLALKHAGVATHGLVLAAGVAAGMLPVLAVRGRLGSLRLRVRTLPLLTAGGFANVAALGLQLIAISTMVVSVFEAFKRAAGLLLAMALGAMLFREKISPAKLFAGLLMAGGIALVLLPQAS